MAGRLELSRKLSRRLGIGYREARLFVRLLTEELAKGLLSDQSVRLRGLGYWRLSRGPRGVRLVFHPSGKLLRRISR